MSFFFPLSVFSRIKEKFENEIRELESAEKSMKEKYIESRTRLASAEADNQNLKALSTQLELQLSHSTKVTADYCRGWWRWTEQREK